VELVKFLGILRRSFPLHPLIQARNVLWRFGLRPVLGMAIHRVMPEAHKASRVLRQLAGDPVWVAPDQELRAEQRRRAESGLTASDPPNGFYMREARMSLDHPLISWQEEERFEMGKRFGIRFLHPFLDPEVVDLCFRSMPHLFGVGGFTKGLVRGTIARRFPGLGLERQRKVMSVPFYQSLLLREWAALVDMAGDFPALSAVGVVDGRAMGACVRAERRPVRMARMFNWIGAEMWVRSRGC
jgi:Asparagine synthase